VQKSCTTWLHSHSVWRQKSSPTIPSSQQQNVSEMPAFSSTGLVYPQFSSSWSRRSATSCVVLLLDSLLEGSLHWPLPSGQAPTGAYPSGHSPPPGGRILADVLEGRGQLHCPAGPPPAGAVRVAHPLQHGTDILNRAVHDHFPHHLLVVAVAVHRPMNPRSEAVSRCSLFCKGIMFSSLHYLGSMFTISMHKPRHSACNALRRKIGQIAK
jgi:hypothetical protein